MGETEKGTEGLEITSWGGICGLCGFTYRAYKGSIIPCPRCKVERLEDLITKAVENLDWMKAPGKTRQEAVEILRKAVGTS